MGNLVVGKASKLGIEFAEKLARRVGAVLVDALVSSRARVAKVHPGQLPDDPVGGFDPVIHSLVNLGILFKKLEPLGKFPLARDESAVPRQPRLSALRRERVDSIGLALCGMVLPELDVGVWAVGKTGNLVEWGAIGENRHGSRRREVGCDTDDLSGIDAGIFDRVRHGVLEHVDVVGGHLQRPLRRKLRAGGRECGIHHRVRVVVHTRTEFRSVGNPNHKRTARQGSVVDSDDELLVTTRRGG